MKKLRIGFILLLVAVICTNCFKEEFLDAPEETRSALKSESFELSEDVEAAIDAGIAYLLTQQRPTGYFNSTSDGVSRTSLAVTKLCDRSVELGYFPSEGPYATEIEEGLNYMFQQAVVNPDGGIYLSESLWHSVYNTSIAMMGIAAARCPDCVVGVSGPLNGFTYQQVLQATVDFFVAAQNPDGGWRYLDHSEPSDNSNTGFAVLGLMAAEAAGIVIPESLKENLSTFIDAIQDDISGGSKYTTSWSWINTLKTGNLLFEMAFVGDPPDAPRVLHALEYLGNHWDDPNSDPGWDNNALAMYCLMKGFVSMGIETITVGSTDVDWYDDFVTEIFTYLPWPAPNLNWTNDYLSTIFSLLTLEKITPVPFIPVNVDVKPGSCPNPLNRKSKGVIPVAILGTDEFDVGTIDPVTVNIEGVYPLRWVMEDVAAPYLEGWSDPPSEMDCTTEGSDGFMDLVLHFDTQEIAALFTDNVRDDIIFIQLDGQLIDDGPSIMGEDVMIIVDGKLDKIKPSIK
jgi:hypothetical protein